MPAATTAISALAVVLAAQLAIAADDPPEAGPDAAVTAEAEPRAVPASANVRDPEAAYLFSDKPLFEDFTFLWDGFLTGLRGFEGFHDPVSNPLYHESPLINTQLKFLYIHHDFPDGNVLDGGGLDTVALQVRVALTERLAFIATKDGYTWFDPGLYPEEEEGWNDLAVGLKYAFLVDRESQFVLTGGIRYEWRVGAKRVFQGDNDELTPFISVGKGWGDFHLLANAAYRIGIDDDQANDVFQWSIHADYEVFDGIAPLVEINGLHYVDDADRLPLSIGGLDYANFGSSDVSGNSVVWLGLGASFKLTPNISLGATYEFPLTDEDDDIMDQRVTFAMSFTF